MQPFVLWQKVEPPYIFGILSNFKKVQIGYLDSHGNKVYYPEYYEYEDISDDYEPEQQPNDKNITGAQWNRYQQRKHFKNLRENLNNSTNPKYTRPQQPNDIQFSPLQQHSNRITKGVSDLMSQASQRQQANDKKVLRGADNLLARVQQQQSANNIIDQYDQLQFGWLGYTPSVSGMMFNDFQEMEFQFQGQKLYSKRSSKEPISNIVTVQFKQGIWEIAKKVLGNNASNDEINNLKNNIIKWNRLNGKGDIEVGQRIFIVDPQSTIGQIRNGRNYYDALGRLLYNTNVNEGVQFLVEDNGKWIHGLSYQSIFGDENKTSPLKYTRKIDIPNFIREIPYYAQNSQTLQFGNTTLTRLHFWKNSGPGGTYDYKYAGRLAELKTLNGEKNKYDGSVLISNNLLINPHEAGMFMWGYAASRAYGGGKWSSYYRLAEDNKKMHLNVEGNTDEWGEVYAWTFGFMMQWHNNVISESLHKDVSDAMKYYYSDDPSYKLRNYRYNVSSEQPEQTTWRKIVEATIIAY